jgi:putative redox protein
MTIECHNEVPGVFRQAVRVDGHTLFADVGVALGGTASAPSPHEYFDTALATCKALTAMMYGKRHGMALDSVQVRVERDASREREGTYVLRVEVEFFGGLSEAEKKRVYDAILRCPIHKLMTTTTVEIETAPLRID